ncbi:MAG: PIN domain-containing protein [Hyphomicrobium sp.]
MSVDCFLDTNIVVYAVDTTHVAAHKRQIARKILRQGSFGVSTQVLQEFYVTATQKLKRPLSVSMAARWIDQLCRAELVTLDASLIKLAISHSKRYQISYWDGAIIAAAEALASPVVYSEDLNNSQSYGSVKVVNPFK